MGNSCLQIATCHKHKTNAGQQQQQQQPPVISLPDMTTLTLQHDAWEIMFSTRMLASFLNGKDVCHLATCGHNFLPFRTQIQHLRLSADLTSSIIAHMSAGRLMHLTTLYVQSCYATRTWSSGEIPKLGPAFRALPHLEHLSVSCWNTPLPVVVTILNSLVKARLKTLSLDWVGKGGNESMFADAFEGFHNLESLDLRYCSNPVVAPYAVAQMERGEFSRLRTLRIWACRLRESDACKIFRGCLASSPLNSLTRTLKIASSTMQSERCLI
jgi:hypothetical protein